MKTSTRLRAGYSLSVAAIACLTLQPSCGFLAAKGKRHGNDNQKTQGSDSPVFKSELKLALAADGDNKFESVYMIPGVPSPDQTFTINASFADNGKPLPKDIFVEAPPYRASQRADGLWNIEKRVIFRATYEAIRGINITVTADKIMRDGKPLVMTTKAILVENSYLTEHRDPESLAAGLAVIKDDSFLDVTKDNATIANMIERAKLGATGSSTEANQDLQRAAAAWEIVRRGGETIYSQRAPAALILSNPGKAIIETNGFPFMGVGDKWAGVEIRLGNCGRPIDNPLCKIADEKKISVALLTSDAPKVAHQLVAENGSTLFALDGIAGKTPSEAKVFELCEQQLPSKKDLPDGRANCQSFDKGWHGKNLELHLKMTSSDIVGLEMPHELYRSTLNINETPESYLFTDGTGSACTDSTCLFDFDKTSVKTAPDGTVFLDEEFRLEMQSKADKKENLPSEFPTNKSVAQRIDSIQIEFDFDRKNPNAAWKSLAAGYEGAFAQADVEDWANAQCETAVETAQKSWMQGVPMPDLNKVREPTASDVAARGVDVREVDLSARERRWVVSDTKASTEIQSTPDQGDFSLEIFARDPNNEAIFTEDATRLVGDSLVVGGKALELLRPITGTLEAEGLPGGNGADTPTALLITGGNLKDSLLALTGKPGRRGAPYQKSDFRTGRLVPQVYYAEAGARNVDRSSYLTDKNALPCNETSLMAGECSFAYTTRKAEVTAANAAFKLNWGTRSIVASYSLPWRGYSSAEGSINLPLDARRDVPNFLSILGLEAPAENAARSGSSNTFGLASAPQIAGAREDSPSAQANFWVPGYDDDYTSGFGGIGRRLKKVASNPVVNVVLHTQPVVLWNAAVSNKAREYFEKQEPIIRNDIKSAFTQGILNASTGRHIVYAKGVVKGKAETLACSTVPGFQAGKFAVNVQYQPEHLNANMSHLLQSDDQHAMLGVKRPPALTNEKLRDSVRGAVAKQVEPMFLSMGDLFSEVRTACSETQCFTDVTVTWKVNRKRECTDHGLSCVTRESPEKIKSRVVWFDGQDQYSASLLEECAKTLKEQNEKYDSFLKDLRSSQIFPAMAALTALTPDVVADLADMAATFKAPQFQSQLWGVSDVNARHVPYLDQKTLEVLWTGVKNLSAASTARSSLNKLVESSGFGWDDLTFKEADETDLRPAKANWARLPEESQVRAIRTNLEIIIAAMRPKLTGLVCRVEMTGFLKHYPDSRNHQAGLYDASEHPKVSSISLTKPAYKSAATRIQGAKVWSLTEKVTKKIQIAKPDVSPLVPKITLAIPDTASPGKLVEPRSELVRSCANAGRIAVDNKIPVPKFMFQGKGCQE